VQQQNGYCNEPRPSSVWEYERNSNCQGQKEDTKKRLKSHLLALAHGFAVVLLPVLVGHVQVVPVIVVIVKVPHALINSFRASRIIKWDGLYLERP
jgi:hypothetical protein